MAATTNTAFCASRAASTNVPTSQRGARARASEQFYGPNRAKWLGAYSERTTPKYLTGEFPGDYGWDSAGLCADPQNYARYREIELMHCRWAMLGVVGCLTPEILAAVGMPIPEGVWWRVGASILGEGGLDYLGNPNLIHAQSVIATVALQVVLMGLCEVYRVGGGPAGMGLDPVYPGGVYFDPLGLADDPDTLALLKVKEIQNGRLAQVAMAAFFVQALQTGEGPFRNFLEFAADPCNANGSYNYCRSLLEELAFDPRYGI